MVGIDAREGVGEGLADVVECAFFFLECGQCGGEQCSEGSKLAQFSYLVCGGLAQSQEACNGFPLLFPHAAFAAPRRAVDTHTSVVHHSHHGPVVVESFGTLNVFYPEVENESYFEGYL